MPLGGASVLWNELAPAESDIADAAPIRSIETSIRNAMGSEHNWPSTGGANTGYHLLGSARPFYDVQSNVSSTGTDGRLLVTSDTSSLFHVGSAGTMFLGGSRVISHGSYINQRTYWVEESGSTVWGAGVTNSANIAFPNSGFSGVPFVTMSIMTQLPVNTNSINPVLISVTPTQFQAYFTRNDGIVVGNFTMFWRSLGTRTL